MKEKEFGTKDYWELIKLKKIALLKVPNLKSVVLCTIFNL